MSIISVITFKHFVLALKISATPKSKEELAEAIGVQKATIHEWIKILHTGPNSLVYIAGWKRVAPMGPLTALWAWGYKHSDVLKPPALSQAERAAKYRRQSRIRITGNGVTTHSIGT